MNPFSMIYDALWSLVEASATLMDMIRPGNRIDYGGNGRSPEKDVLATADLPELRLMPAGGSVMLHRSTSSTSCVRRFAFQIHTGTQNIDWALLPIEWELLCALVDWQHHLGELVWNAQKFAVRMSAIDVTEDMLRPRPELGEVGIKGWYTVWVGEVECFFASRMMRPANS